MERLTQEVVKIKQHDTDAFTYVFESTKDYTYSIAYSLLHDYTEAQDIVQETYLKVWLSAEQLQDDRSFLRWLHTITFNICQDHLREHAKSKTLNALTDEQFAANTAVLSPDDWLMDSWNREIIHRMISALPKEQQQVVYLYYYKNHTIGEIAVIQNCSQGTVKSRLFYARNTLQKLIEAEEESTGKMHASPAVTVFSAMLTLPTIGISLGQADAVRILAAVLSAAGAADGFSFIRIDPEPNHEPADTRPFPKLRCLLRTLTENRYFRLRPMAIVFAALFLVMMCTGLVSVGYLSARADGIGKTHDAGSAEITRSEPSSDPATPPSSAVLCEGQCGESATYRLTEDGTLTVSGVGCVGEPIPWDADRARAKEDRSVFTKDEILNRYRDRITSLVIEEGITEIAGCTFMCGNFTSLSLPDTLTDIREAAFAYCPNLEVVVIPDSVVSIHDWAFYQCNGLKSLTIGKKCENVGNESFADAYLLTELIFGNECGIVIGGGAFSHTDSLRKVAFPATKIYFDTYSFSATAIETLDLSQSDATFGNSPFEYAENLTTVILPDSMTTLTAGALSNISGLQSVVFGKSITNIESGCFAYSGISTIHIPETVSYISPKAFINNNSLTSITVDENNPRYCSQNGVLYDKDAVTLIKYPDGRNDTAYTVPESVIHIGAYALSAKHLHSVIFRGNIEIMASDAIPSTSGVTDLYFWGNAPRVWETNAVTAKKHITIHYQKGVGGFTKDRWVAPDGAEFLTIEEDN